MAPNSRGGVGLVKRDLGSDPKAYEDAANSENKADKISANLVPLCEKLQELQSYAASLGIFTNDRELLTCPACGLQEDVTIEGMLITHNCKCPDAGDSGLRFTELSAALFACPNCGTKIDASDCDFFGTPGI